MKRILGVSILVLLLFLVGGMVYYFSFVYGDKPVTSYIEYKDPQLTQEQKQRFIDEIIKAEKELVELGKEAKPEERYQRYLHIASNQFPLGEYKKSRDAYLEAAKILPQYPLPWYGAATVELAMQDHKSALVNLDKALNIDPANPEYWRLKILTIRQFNSPSDQEIRSLYADAFAQTRDSVDIISSYAKYLSEINDLVGAVQQWKKAIERNPEGKAIYEAEITRIQDRLK